jgi:PAS domain S-box-containing protein
LHSLFREADDAIFVLDRRRRLIFVNRAWETLAGLAADQVLGLACRRPEPASATDAPDEILAHALTPPPEVLQGTMTGVRRLLPAPGRTARWWDVEFFPLRQRGEPGRFYVLGRVLSVPMAAPPVPVALPEKLAALRERQARRHSLDLLSGSPPAVRRLVEQARLAARITTPVLLVGESGSGKRTVARVIHFLGPNRERGFAALDCAHLPPAALAAVLFGAAIVPGTLYLSQPGALPREVQQRLCEALARRAADPAAPPRPCIITACDSDPEADVTAGRLLEELRCALSTLVLEVPPLRERLDDLPSLVERFLKRIHEESGDPANRLRELPGEPRTTALSPAAWDLFRGYAWPGNLRELFAVLRAACSHATGDRIDAGDLPARLRLTCRLAETPGPVPERVIPLDEVLEGAERRLIELALRKARGNQTRAAELLAIWRPRLIRRMKALGINGADENHDKGQANEGEPGA